MPRQCCAQKLSELQTNWQLSSQFQCFPWWEGSSTKAVRILLQLTTSSAVICGYPYVYAYIQSLPALYTWADLILRTAISQFLQQSFVRWQCYSQQIKKGCSFCQSSNWQMLPKPKMLTALKSVSQMGPLQISEVRTHPSTTFILRRSILLQLLWSSRTFLLPETYLYFLFFSPTNKGILIFAVTQ